MLISDHLTKHKIGTISTTIPFKKLFHHNIDYDFKSVGMKQTNPLCQKYVFHNFDLDEWTCIWISLVLQNFCLKIDTKGIEFRM